jgi:glycolate oxidase
VPQVTVPLAELRAALGADAVLTSPEDMVAYSTDATPLFRGRPEAVCLASSRDHVVAVLELAERHRFPVTPRASGTNLSAGAVPLHGGVVLSVARMRELLEIDEANLTATCRPGLQNQELQERVGRLGLFYPPDPGSQVISTIGGNVMESSGGLRGLKYGVTRDYVLGLEAVLVGGRVLRVGGKNAKDVAGYDLVRLLVGSEGTLAVVTEITVRLLPAPEAKQTGAAFFADLEGAARTVSRIVAGRIVPATLEFLDRTTMRVVDEMAGLGLPVDAGAMLVFGQDGAAELVERDVARMAEACRAEGALSVQVAADDAEADRLLQARRGAIPALARLAPTLMLEDATVPRSELAGMVREVQAIAEDEGLLIAVFGHAGDGNLHPTCCIDEDDPDQVERAHRAFHRIFEAALARGGTITGEHGIGATKLRYLESRVGSTGIELLRGIKRTFDPHGLLNPGKAVP